MGNPVEEHARGGREHGHHMGMGHGFKKLAKMVFAPRLPQSWQGGGEQEHLVIDPLYNRQKP